MRWGEGGLRECANRTKSADNRYYVNTKLRERTQRPRMRETRGETGLFAALSTFCGPFLMPGNRSARAFASCAGPVGQVRRRPIRDKSAAPPCNFAFPRTCILDMNGQLPVSSTSIGESEKK
jgi:hypothetical protein